MINAARLTVLSDMAHQTKLGPAGSTPASIANRLQSWDLIDIDLKSVLGKNIAEVSDQEAHDIADTFGAAGIATEAFSTLLFKREVESGPEGFETDLQILDRVLAIARIVKPKKIRLLGADLVSRNSIAHSTRYLKADAPWLLDYYGQAIARIADAGFAPVIENETNGCIFSKPSEVTAFFSEVAHAQRASFVWDVQNMWEMGTFPTIEAYRELRELIGYFHLKGGRAAPGTRVMTWRSSLEQADWPVEDITAEVLADRKSAVICLNPPHGSVAPDDRPCSVTATDIDFLRGMFPGSISGRRLRTEELA